MTVWADGLKVQGEEVVCPLCRHVWENHSVAAQLLSPATTLLLGESTQPDMPLPYAPPVSLQEHPGVRGWVNVFGEALVACLHAREWAVREAGLRRVNALLFARLGSSDPAPEVRSFDCLQCDK